MIISWVRYSGLKSCNILNINNNVLNWIAYLTGSQWTLNNRVFFTPHTSQNKRLLYGVTANFTQSYTVLPSMQSFKSYFAMCRPIISVSVFLFWGGVYHVSFQYVHLKAELVSRLICFAVHFRLHLTNHTFSRPQWNCLFPTTSHMCHRMCSVAREHEGMWLRPLDYDTAWYHETRMIKILRHPPRWPHDAAQSAPPIYRVTIVQPFPFEHVFAVEHMHALFSRDHWLVKCARNTPLLTKMPVICLSCRWGKIYLYQETPGRLVRRVIRSVGELSRSLIFRSQPASC